MRFLAYNTENCSRKFDPDRKMQLDLYYCQEKLVLAAEATNYRMCVYKKKEFFYFYPLQTAKENLRNRIRTEKKPE